MNITRQDKRGLSSKERMVSKQAHTRGKSYCKVGTYIAAFHAPSQLELPPVIRNILAFFGRVIAATPAIQAQSSAQMY